MQKTGWRAAVVVALALLAATVYRLLPVALSRGADVG